jgi:hypothetical protein
MWKGGRVSEELNLALDSIECLKPLLEPAIKAIL